MEIHGENEAESMRVNESTNWHPDFQSFLRPQLSTSSIERNDNEAQGLMQDDMTTKVDSHDLDEMT